jgi:E3 ubiquitin-protein ligase listerin
MTATTIISAITSFAPNPPLLDRHRNELAASLLSIKSSDANVDGLIALRKLMSCAPPADSEIIFLPQQRALNVIKACEKWFSDENVEIDAEVESAMTAVFAILAPILQDLSGGHWDFVWDLVENNLDVNHSLPTMLFANPNLSYLSVL